MSSKNVALLLRGGSIYDGTGAPASRGDIGIVGDTIACVGEGAGAQRVIDIEGLAVSPGFIDTHCHSDFSLIADPLAEGKVLQGITTEINGNCGMSAAPLKGEALVQREGDLAGYGIEERWDNFQEYFSLLESRGISVNFATLVGHGNIRASVMGYVRRKPTVDERDMMRRLLEDAVNAGALGISTGLIYPPGIYAETDELADLAACGGKLAGSDFVYASHMRSEGSGLLEAIEEAISIGRKAVVRVHISHLKTSGKENWSKVDGAVALLEDARTEGVRITCDRYPYTASSTDLDAVLPDWAFEGGNKEEMRRLTEPETCKRLRDEMKSGNPEWGDVRVSTVGTEKNMWMTGLSVSEIASRLKVEPEEAVIRVLLEEKLRVGAVFHGMSEENLQRFLALPYMMIGSDSSARSFHGPLATGKPHPRGFGSFPRYLKRYAGDLSGAIGKVTLLPAETFGLKDRGRIAEGYKADIVVFDREKISDRATFDDPFQPPDGICHVIVNGTPVVEDGKVTGKKPGRVVRRTDGRL